MYIITEMDNEFYSTPVVPNIYNQGWNDALNIIVDYLDEDDSDVTQSILNYIAEIMK